MSAGSASKAWLYFTRDKKTESATCNKCHATIMCKGFSTSGLLRHLKNVHKEVDIAASKKRSNEDTATEVKNCQPKITTFLKNEESIEEIVSKLAAVDGFSINAIAKSEYIRKTLSDKGMTLPKNPSHIMNMVKSQYHFAKQQVIKEMAIQIECGSRFSVSMDEYSSIKNRRYMNLNVHSSTKFWNLGMIRIFGTLPAEKIVNMVENKLREFNLSTKEHIISCVTDGASVMKKFGRLSSMEHQQCYAHGLHLAVTDVLYKKAVIHETSVSDCDEHECSSAKNHSEDDESDETDIEEKENKFISSVEFQSSENDDTNIELIGELAKTIQKVRKIVRIFRKSPLKNETLQKYVKIEYDKELKLILDVKTRWNSLFTMLERFIALKTCIMKALMDLNLNSLDNIENISEDEYLALNLVVKTLQPIRIGIERLGRRNANILEAEGVLLFIFDDLSKNKNWFSTRMLQSVKQRIVERRNANLVGLLKYLNNPSNYKYELETDSTLLLPSKAILKATAKTIFSKLFVTNNNESASSYNTEELDMHGDRAETSLMAQTNNSTLLDLTLHQKLDSVIANVTKVENPEDILYDVNNISKEMNIFEVTGKRTDNLEKLYNALMTIPPTSVESERAFSAAGLFITKIRSSLSDSAIDNLCFLKNFCKN